MRVLVFSDRAEAAQWFAKVSRSRSFAVERHPVVALDAELARLGAPSSGARRAGAPGRADARAAAPDALLYFECGRRRPAALAALLRRAASREGLLPAVLDPCGELGDVAPLFRAGAVDYLGPGLLRAGVDVGRLRDIAAWATSRADGAAAASAPARAGGAGAAQAAAVGRADADGRAGAGAVAAGPLGLRRRSRGQEAQPVAEPAPGFAAALSGGDWKGMRSGHEYVFSLMFIEMDNQDTLRREHGSEALAKFQQIFHDTVAGIVAPAQGRPWIWSEFGGVLLFPFNGDRCDAVVTCFRLMLNRKLLAIEMYDFDLLPSFRIALHIGATTYHARGQTGRIVSDSVNTIFHLGQKFTQAGQPVHDRDGDAVHPCRHPPVLRARGPLRGPRDLAHAPAAVAPLPPVAPLPAVAPPPATATAGGRHRRSQRASWRARNSIA